MADELVFKLTVQDDGSQKIGAFEQTLRKLEKELIRLDATFKKTFTEMEREAAEPLADVDKALGAFTGTAKNAAASLKGFRGSFNSAFGRLGEPITSLSNLNDQLMNLAGGYAASGVQLLGQAVVDAGQNFVEFQALIGDVERTANLSAEGADNLGESLRRMSVIDLKGQANADELAKIAGIAGTLGMSASEDILSFSKAIVHLSVATGESSEKVATQFSKITGIFSKQLGDDAYQQVGKIGSAFDWLNDSIANVSFDPLMNIASRIGKSANDIGITVDQTAAFAAVIQSLGFTSEAGSTAFKKFANILSSDAPKVAMAFKLPVNEFVEAVRTKPAEAIQMLLKQMEEMKKGGGENLEDVNARIKQVFGSGQEVNDMLKALSNNTELVGQALAGSKAAYDEGTRSADSFAKKTEQVDALWKQVGSNFHEVSLALGTALGPAISGISAQLAETSTAFAEFFSGLQMGDISFGDIFAGLPEAFKLTLEDTWSVVPDFIDGIAELFGAGAIWQGFEDSFSAAWNVMKANFFLGLNELKTNAADAWLAIKDAFSATWADMVAIGDIWADLFGGAKTQASEAWAAIKTLGDTSLQELKDAFLIIIQDIVTAFKNIPDNLKAAFTGIADTAKTELSKLTDGLPESVQKLLGLNGQKLETITLPIDTAPTLESLSAIREAVAATGDQELMTRVNETFGQMQQAIRNNLPVTDELQGKFTSMTAELEKLGYVSHGGSVWPDMLTAIIGVQPGAQTLENMFVSMTGTLTETGKASAVTASEMKANIDGVESSIKAMEAEYVAAKAAETDMSAGASANAKILAAEIKNLKASINAKTQTVFGIEDVNAVKNRIKDLEAEKASLTGRGTAGAAGSKEIKAALDAEKAKLSEMKDAYREISAAEKERAREAERAAKERAKAEEFLQESSANTAELRAKQRQDEMQAENELYREQQKQAADSIKWVGDLDDATKKRILGEKDAVKALEAQGVVLTDLQQQEIRRMQGAYQTEQAYEAQAKALRAQLDPMGALLDGVEKFSSGIGGLSSNLRDIGAAFGEDFAGGTQQLTDAFKEQEAALKTNETALKDVEAQLTRNKMAQREASGEQLDALKSEETALLNKRDTMKLAIDDEKAGLDQLKESGEAYETVQKSMLQSTVEFLEKAKGYGDLVGTFGDLFGSLKSIAGAGKDILGGLGGLLSGEGLGGIGSAVSSLLGLGGAAAAAAPALGGAAAAATGVGAAAAGAAAGGGGLLANLGGVAAAAGPAALAIGAVALAGYGLYKVFEDTKSKGTEAADSFQQFVTKNIEGGAEMAQALETNFHAMGAAGFDFQTFLQQTGTTMDQTFGGISANWQEGSTAMDIFTQSVMASGVEMAKAPQVALQMMASFQDMGLSAEDAGAKMLEIAEKAGMSAEELEKLKVALEGASAATDAISPIEIPVEVDPDGLNAGLEEVKAMVSDASAYMNETGADWLDFIDEAEFSTLTEKIQALGESGVISADQMNTLLPMIAQIGEDGRVTAEEMAALNEAMTVLNQQGVISTSSALEGLTANLGSMTFGVDASAQAFDLFSNSLTNAQIAGQMTDVELDGLSTKLQQISSDGSLTNAELLEFGNALQAAGVPTAELKAQILDLAAASGISGADLTVLQDTLGLVGMSEDEAIAKTNELKLALQGGGEEGEVTGSVFDKNSESVDVLTTKVFGLTTSLGGVQSQFSGATAQAGAFASTLKQVAAEAANVATVQVSRFANGGYPSGLAIFNERGSEIANIPGFGMALMTSRGATLGAFPAGTEIIPHQKSMQILRDYPTIPRMATGGTVGALPAQPAAPVVNNYYTFNVPSTARILDKTAFERFTRDIIAETNRQQRLIKSA